MSGSGRKRSSKWDLRDEPEFAPDIKHPRSGWSSSDVAGSNNSKWSYLEGNDKLKPNMGFQSKETFSGGRNSNKDDITNKDCGDLDATIAWDADGNYSKNMSPRFEEWKHKRRSQSPKNGWSRSVRSSRSRSPARGFRWDSGVNDRNRMRAGGSTQLCRDFAAGKCRRGSHCHFLHHDNQNYEDSWESRHKDDVASRYSAPHESRDYSFRSGRSNEPCINFAKGRCRMGASCKYVHHNNSDGVGKGSMDESTRERDTDTRRRENSFEQGGGHGPNRSGDTPCKFFAVGNCRNGKYCRFSHDRHACRSPDRRLRDDRWGSNPAGDHQVLDRPKLSESVSPNVRPRDDRWGLDGNMTDADKVWDTPKRNDTVVVSEAAKLVEDKSGNMGAPELGLTAWSVKDGWDHSLDKSRVHGEPPLLREKKEANRWTAENAVANMHVSQALGTDNWSGDAEMSPDWHYGVVSSSHIDEEHGQNQNGLALSSTHLATSEQGGIQVAPGNHMLDVLMTLHPLSIEKSFTLQVQNQSFKKYGVITLASDDKSDIKESADSCIDLSLSTVLPGQGFNQNAQNVNALQSSCHAIGQSQVAVPILSSRGGIVEGIQNQEVSAEKKYIVEPNIMDAGLSQVSSRNLPTQNMVSKEQLAQLTNLSASLAHILGTGQQLPQLYAALNSHDAKDPASLAKTEVPGKPVATTVVKPDPAVGFQKQYDPMCDSIEPKNSDAMGVAIAFSPIKKSAEDEAKIPSLLSNSGRQICGDSCKTACSEEQLVKSEHLIQSQPGQNIEIKENNEVVADERQNSQDDDKIMKENGPLENMDQNGGPDEAKKIKDVKGIRAFKFALVEFVKELLKPTWKEGQITKEDYKTIVKKVVDKVTGTMQGAHIPQTQEKIDHYLSFSKPKLNKLVQAYVEKAQKA